MGAPSLRFDLLDHVFLIVHADVPPDANDWRAMTAARDANRQRIRGSLVVVPPRASINAAQRTDEATFMKQTGVSIAVITDSALIRGIALAVGFLGGQVRAFPSKELTSAFRYLMIPAVRHGDFARRIDGMKVELAARQRVAL